MIVRRGALAIALLLAAVGCSDNGVDRSRADGRSTSPGSTEAAATIDETMTTARDYTATTAPECTVGTIPEGRSVPLGCDRLYSPFLSPGASCIEGQSSNCIDPDGDGSFTFIMGGGRCMVERKVPERCRDDDGDGRLNEPLPG